MGRSGGGFGEVVTVQIGGYANFVGAHFWNFQDELLDQASDGSWQSPATLLDFNVLYSEVNARQADSRLTPRLLVLDLRGSTGGFSFDYASPAHDSNSASVWSGVTAVHRQEVVPTTEFVNRLIRLEQDTQDDAGAGALQLPEEEGSGLEAAATALDAPGGVTYWTDYLKAYLKPASVYELPGLWQDVVTFDGWGHGSDLWRRDEVGEAAGDRIRRLVEDCDHMQGFQVLVDDCSGFGGLASDALADLREEYGNKAISLFCVRRPTPAPAEKAPPDTVLHINRAASLSYLTQHASLYCPLTAGAALRVPSLDVQLSRPYHSSALLGAFIDAASTPYRMYPQSSGNLIGSVGLDDVCGLIAGRAQCGIAYSALAFPAARIPHASVDAALAAASGHHSMHSTPHHAQQLAGVDALFDRTTCVPVSGAGGAFDWPDKQLTAESLVLRGLWSDAQAYGTPLQPSSAQAVAQAALTREGLLRSVHHLCISGMCTAVPLPFPRILRTNPTAPATSSAASTPPFQRAQPSVPSMTRMWGSWRSREYVDGHVTDVRRALRSSCGRSVIGSWGWTCEDTRELEETLQQLSGQYTSSVD